MVADGFRVPEAVLECIQTNSDLVPVLDTCVWISQVGTRPKRVVEPLMVCLYEPRHGSSYPPSSGLIKSRKLQNNVKIFAPCLLSITIFISRSKDPLFCNVHFCDSVCISKLDPFKAEDGRGIKRGEDGEMERLH